MTPSPIITNPACHGLPRRPCSSSTNDHPTTRPHPSSGRGPGRASAPLKPIPQSRSSLARALTRTLLILFIAAFLPTTHATPHATTLPRIALAIFTTAEPALTPACFSTRFLTLAKLEAGLDVAPTLSTVQLNDREAMDRHPIAIMSGEGAFQLSAAELTSLRDYLERGGFLIASAGCSSHPWATSFERTIERLRQAPGWETAKLEPIETGHELLETVYAVRSLSTRKAAQDGATSEGPIGKLFALTLEGRVCIIYSPDGLNDTDSAGQGCCCCGGSELREARWIKVNALAYALLR